MFVLQLTQQSLSIPQMIARYRDADRFLAFCRDCKNYGVRWSCPPLNFDPLAYLGGFGAVCILGAKVIFTPQAIEQADTQEKVWAVTRQTLGPVKEALCQSLLELEALYPGCRSLFVGGCEHCSNCARSLGQPCAHPERMRYSLDALGFDLSALTSDLLGIELLWAKDSLPAYYTLINGFLLPEGCSLPGQELIDALARGLRSQGFSLSQ